MAFKSHTIKTRLDNYSITCVQVCIHIHVCVHTLVPVCICMLTIAPLLNSEWGVLHVQASPISTLRTLFPRGKGEYLCVCPLSNADGL